MCNDSVLYLILILSSFLPFFFLLSFDLPILLLFILHLTLSQHPQLTNRQAREHQILPLEQHTGCPPADETWVGRGEERVRGVCVLSIHILNVLHNADIVDLHKSCITMLRIKCVYICMFVYVVVLLLHTDRHYEFQNLQPSLCFYINTKNSTTLQISKYWILLKTPFRLSQTF